MTWVGLHKELETIKINEAEMNLAMKRIREIIKEYGVSKNCVGFPKNMNGTIGPRGEASQEFAKNIRKKVSTPSRFMGRTFNNNGS